MWPGEISKGVANEMGRPHPVLRKEDSFLVRKMLMRIQKPYEEGSILLDAPQHDTMYDLVELARDKEEQKNGSRQRTPFTLQNEWLRQCSSVDTRDGTP